MSPLHFPELDCYSSILTFAFAVGGSKLAESIGLSD